MNKRRRRNSKESEDDLISVDLGSVDSDESFEDCDIIINDFKVDKKYTNKFNKLINEIKNKNITINHILKLNLSNDDSIWFIEYLNIINNLTPNTEEKYKLKQKIYEKYTQVISSNYTKLSEQYSLNADPDENLVQKIFKSNHNDHVKSLLFNKFSRISKQGTSEEYASVVNYINHVLLVPTEIKMTFDDIKMKLSKFWEVINKNVYGLIQVKEKILEALNSYLMSNGNTNFVITLIGSPGVGKTSTARALAEALNISYGQISMSDISDSNILIGHMSSYIGSHPGVLVNILQRTHRLDNLILFDEIDKIKTDQMHSSDLSHVLLKIFDKTQNKYFNDAYMPEIDIDLSRNIFIATANDEKNIPKALNDRLYKIYIDKYSKRDKLEMAKYHIIPKIILNLKINKKDIIFGDNEISYLIDTLDDTDGVRNIDWTFFLGCFVTKNSL